MMKPKNIKEFKNLIEKYESITLEEIQKVWEEDNGYDVVSDLTGFGSQTTCTLCRAVKECCTECIYFRRRKEDHMYCCNTGKNTGTYDAIEEADSPVELLEAFRQRAKHMRKAYSKYLI